MAERDAQLHATFSHKFSSFPRRLQCDVIFQQRNINSLSVLSVSALLARKSCKDVANEPFPFSFLTNFTRSERRRNLFPSRGERYVGEKKGKETLLIEGFSINVSCRMGIIFSARKRPLHLFSAIFLGPSRRPLLPLPSPVSRFEREIFSNVQTCFSGGFLAARPRGSGSDCRRDLTRD